MKLVHLADPIRFARMTTEELRETFLVTSLFERGKLMMCYVDLDRTIVGSAVPTDQPLELATHELLKSACFTERRELGVFNIGGVGRVMVGNENFLLNRLDALYVGRGNRHVQFESKSATEPAEFYFLSYPAHAEWPARLVRSADVSVTPLGDAKTANQREIRRLIHLGGVRSCQLVMGFTQLAPGSVWNTMPPHTHSRRSEVYLYFDLSETERVVHLMGPPQQTRNLIIANKQALISPGWSIHAGAGTTNYSFCWGMGGENQDYEDMDRLAVADLL
jgi:4-deoxy-L-threo-5-hexosulose-uronate ketol-isomerase